MEETSPSKSEDKPFSVLERFRQLKKEKEQAPVVESVQNAPTQSSTTVFQALPSSHNSQNADLGRGSGFRQNREYGGRLKGKRGFNNSSEERLSKKISSEFHIGQKETDCGITEFVRDGAGFDVILKHRYTDFHVNEIDLDGNVMKLTSTDIPEDNIKTEPLVTDENPSILPPEKWAALRNIVDKELNEVVEVDVTDFDKELRQRIHKAVKRRFGVQVASNTMDVDGRKMLKIGRSNNTVDSRFCSWPKERPEYLHFLVYKENTDMTEAINVISHFTHIKSNRFGFAGTKDKRAATTQQMCVRRVTVDRFATCHKLRGIAVGNFNYKIKNLRLGDLSGNRFRIVLRHIKTSDEVVGDAVDHFKKTGFINYFGLQRFGQSVLVPTYAVGKAILKGDWQQAIELILKPRPGESCYRDVREAREVWWKTRDASEALIPLTRKDKTIEGKILQGLKRHGPKAYQNAFDNLPSKTVSMYLHSYQSLIWNKIVSRRIQEYGLKVLPGDLVRVQSSDTMEDSGSDDEDEEELKAEEVVVGFSRNLQVKALSVEEAATASIYDVLYPLPGDNIRFPDNALAQWYTQMLEEDGHSMECFRKVNKKYGMNGSYRHMMERAQEVSWHTVRYSDPDTDILLSDLEILRGKSPPKNDPDGPYKAVILEFNLKACCYATMAIRELTKCETSTSSQALLTNQAKEEDIANKRKKMEENNEQEQVQKMETESVTDNTNGDTKGSDQDISCNTESETSIVCQLPEVHNSNGITDEVGEMNKREAEADNIINRYLESTR